MPSLHSRQGPYLAQLRRNASLAIHFSSQAVRSCRVKLFAYPNGAEGKLTRDGVEVSKAIAIQISLR